MTGCNPGQHGVYDFVRYEGGSYQPKLISGAWRAVPTIWRMLSEAGHRVGVVNVPFTYPPEPVSGFMISGLDAPAFDARSVYPTELYDDLIGRFRDYDMSPVPRRGASYDLDALGAQTRTLTDLSLYLAERHPVDVLAVVYPGSDHVAHRCWHSRRVTWGSRTVEDVLLWIYEDIDAALDRLLAAVSDEALKLVISDHGATGIATVMNLNGVLRDAGLLTYRDAGSSSLGLLSRLRSRVKKRLSLDTQRWLMRRLPFVRNLNWKLREAEIDWDRTALFTSGPFGMLRLNLKGREGRGIVTPGTQADAVLSRAEEALASLLDDNTGRPFVERLARRQELYSGDRVQDAPDAVVVLRPDAGCYLPPPLQRADTPALIARHTARERFGVRQEGTHAFNGLLVAAGRSVARSGGRVQAALADLAPTILTVLGLPVPAYMDGSVLLDVAGSTGARRGKRVPSTSADSRGPDYTGADGAEIEERLRSLGYL
jgi:predicted AlkP superfamily phosphohydrolase/phosphomutase